MKRLVYIFTFIIIVSGQLLYTTEVVESATTSECQEMDRLVKQMILLIYKNVNEGDACSTYDNCVQTIRLCNFMAEQCYITNIIKWKQMMVLLTEVADDAYSRCMQETN